MKTSIVIGASALVLAGVLATGHVYGQESSGTPAIKETQHEKLEAREARRRADVAGQQRRKDDFARNCIKSGLSAVELEACRVAYRRM